jgi:putative hemolysin
MMAHLHRIPAAGNRFTMEEYTYEVVDMDGMRVDKVLVTPPKAEEPDDKD